jgi:hypothetical protein
MKHLLATAALVALLPALALAQQPPPTLTRSYTYEWVHLRFAFRDADGAPFHGLLLMEDVQGVQSRFVGYLRGHEHPDNGSTVVVEVFDCAGRTDGLSLPTDGLITRDANIVQVGPFAQQAAGDASPILDELDTLCRIAPASVTIDCPFAGIPAPQAPGHVTFSHSGTYRTDANTNLPGSYSQTGRHGPAFCRVHVNGTLYIADAFLTRMKETRRGQDVTPDPVWQEPRGWFLMEDLARPRDVLPPG